ncbi:MAG: ATP-grasp domain-containing protein [Deltaproteobacteria bacterium]|nr:ATP-grasp domain-containing protein [Deltaproteobacteria bacterium]
MRTLMLFDLSESPPPDQCAEAYAEDMKAEEWESEAGVFSALRAAGHEVRLFGVYDDFHILLDEIRLNRPDVVFNLAEAFAGDRARETNVASLLELLGLPFTGADSKALQLCKDKALASVLVAHAGVRVPRFEVSTVAQPLSASKLRELGYPAFVKPAALESSTGISQDSFVENEREAAARIRFVHDRLNEDAVIAEYIEGRELYVSVLGNWDGGRLEVFPTRELFFAEVPEGDPKIATFKAKWDDAYRKKWGIKNGFARGLSAELEDRLADTGRRIFRALQIRGYARIDLRLTPADELVFLEANPNPSIARDDDFAQAALKSGLTYEKLIARIIKLSEA